MAHVLGGEFIDFSKKRKKWVWSTGDHSSMIYQVLHVWTPWHGPVTNSSPQRWPFNKQALLGPGKLICIFDTNQLRVVSTSIFCQFLAWLHLEVGKEKDSKWRHDPTHTPRTGNTSQQADIWFLKPTWEIWSYIWRQIGGWNEIWSHIIDITFFVNHWLWAVCEHLQIQCFWCLFEIKGAGCAAWLFGEGACVCTF